MIIPEVFARIKKNGWPGHPLAHYLGLSAYIADRIMVEGTNAEDIGIALQERAIPEISHIDITRSLEVVVNNKFHLYLQAAIRDGEIKDVDSFYKFMLRDHPSSRKLKKESGKE